MRISKLKQTLKKVIKESKLNENEIKKLYDYNNFIEKKEFINAIKKIESISILNVCIVFVVFAVFCIN